MAKHKVCACGNAATHYGERVADPEYAARVVASVHGILRPSDFVRVYYCADCLPLGADSDEYMEVK